MDNNPYLVEGADTQFYFTMEDQSGVPIDLTGATAQLKSKFFTKSFTIEDPTAGVISIWLGPAELSKKDYLYQADVIIFMSNGHVFKPFEQLEFYVRGGY